MKHILLQATHFLSLKFYNIVTSFFPKVRAFFIFKFTLQEKISLTGYTLHVVHFKTSVLHTSEVLAVSFCSFRNTNVKRIFFLSFQQTWYCAALGYSTTPFKINHIYIYILTHKVRQTSGLLYLLDLLSRKCCFNIRLITRCYTTQHSTIFSFTPTSDKHRPLLCRTRFVLQISPARCQMINT